MLIKKITKNDELYIIDFSDFTLEVDENTLIRFNLYSGKNIDDINEIKESVKYELEYKKAKQFLKKPKSEYEVRKILTCYEDKIILRLKENYFINDKMYAENYKIKMENKRFGKNKIIKDLVDVKISEDIILDLEFLHEKENIRYIIDHKNINKSNRSLRDDLVKTLLLKGFNMDDILDELNDFKTCDDEIILKDLDKALRKYKDFKEKELKIKVIKYLLSRGYEMDLINKVISL